MPTTDDKRQSRMTATTTTFGIDANTKMCINHIFFYLNLVSAWGIFSVIFFSHIVCDQRVAHRYFFSLCLLFNRGRQRLLLPLNFHFVSEKMLLINMHDDNYNEGRMKRGSSAIVTPTAMTSKTAEIKKNCRWK